MLIIPILSFPPGWGIASSVNSSPLPNGLQGFGFHVSDDADREVADGHGRPSPSPQHSADNNNSDGLYQQMIIE